jgi:hypothetical protein
MLTYRVSHKFFSTEFKFYKHVIYISMFILVLVLVLLQKFGFNQSPDCCMRSVVIKVV